MCIRNRLVIAVALLSVGLTGCSLVTNNAPTSSAYRPEEPGVMFSTDQVDSPPRLFVAPEAEYPRLAEVAGLEGDVVLSVIVTSSGRVFSAEVSQSSEITSLDESAREAVYKYSYDPARIDDVTVACRVTEVIEFRLRLE